MNTVHKVFDRVMCNLQNEVDNIENNEDFSGFGLSYDNFDWIALNFMGQPIVTYEDISFEKDEDNEENYEQVKKIVLDAVKTRHLFLQRLVKQLGIKIEEEDSEDTQVDEDTPEEEMF